MNFQLNVTLVVLLCAICVTSEEQTANQTYPEAPPHLRRFSGGLRQEISTPAAEALNDDEAATRPERHRHAHNCTATPAAAAVNAAANETRQDHRRHQGHRQDEQEVLSTPSVAALKNGNGNETRPEHYHRQGEEETLSTPSVAALNETAVNAVANVAAHEPTRGQNGTLSDLHDHRNGKEHDEQSEHEENDEEQDEKNGEEQEEENEEEQSNEEPETAALVHNLEAHHRERRCHRSTTTVTA